jgi:Fe-Mn family superoxide dismutase
MSKLTERELIKSIKEDLGMPKDSRDKLSESYVTQAKKFNLSTDLLGEKTNKAHQELFEEYVATLNDVSAELDTADRDLANSRDSVFRSLKIDETYGINASFLHAYYFENIADPQSKITMDSLAFMRLERDFGTFDSWQKDFIACALSSRSGWAITVYNGFLNRYMNVVVDLHSLNVPINCYPVIVLDMWEHAYYRDYLKDKKSYVFAMMKELNWDVVENRFKKSERISKSLK